MEPPPGPPTVRDATAVAVAVDDPASTIVNAAVAAATATLIAAVQQTDRPDDDGPVEPQGECRLMGPFSLIIQAALGALALLSLVYKRWRERPQRPVKIWFFDASKQVFGSVLVHIANIFMSMLTSGRFSIDKVEPGPGHGHGHGHGHGRMLFARQEDDYIPNPCSFYLLNLAIDTTIGIPILIILLKITTGLVAMTPLGQPPESIQSGYYGNPPNKVWWLKQSVIYFFGLFGMKICVLIIFLVLPWISVVGDWALSWTEGNERLQIAFVMMIFPLIMNAMQYYIIDSFIKKKDPEDYERSPSDDPDESRRLHHDHTDEGEELLTSSDSEDDDDTKKPTTRIRQQESSNNNSNNQEYDPNRDGDERTVIGSSSSSRRYEPDKSVPPELYPKE